MRRLRKALCLAPADWLGLLQAYRYLLAAGWGLRVAHARLDSWLRLGALDGPSPAAAALDADRARKAARYVDLASRYPFRWARCLQRSLALCMWLKAQRGAPVLRIGVRKKAGTLEAHAWVEYNGHVLNDGPIVEREFARLRAAREVARTSRPQQ